MEPETQFLQATGKANKNNLLIMREADVRQVKLKLGENRLSQYFLLEKMPDQTIVLLHQTPHSYVTWKASR